MLSVNSPKHKRESSPDHDFLERKLHELERAGKSVRELERMWKTLTSVTHKRILEFQRHENSNALPLVGTCNLALPTVPRMGDISKSPSLPDL